jgi:hypothetical protein
MIMMGTADELARGFRRKQRLAAEIRQSAAISSSITQTATDPEPPGCGANRGIKPE